MTTDEDAFSGNPLRQIAHNSRDPELIPEHVLALYDRGQCLAARRALKAASRKEKDEIRRSTQEELLEQRGLWLQPMGSPPTLFTLNTIGTIMSGRYQPDDEGFYVKTLYLSAIFLPLLPLASYVVRDSEEGGWLFYAKAPMPPLARLQQLGIAGLFGTVLVGGTAALAWSGAQSELIVVNGFDRVIEVEVDGDRIPVDPHAFVTIDTMIWQDVHVRTRLLDPDVELEELDVAGADWGEAAVYNPGSRALLSQGWVRWGNGDPPDAVELWRGPVAHIPAPDYLFEEPEETRWVDEHSYEQAVWLDWSWEDAGHDPVNEIGTLVRYEAFPFASEHARAVLHDHPDSESAYMASLPIVEDPAAVLEAQVASYPDATHAHRMLQGVLGDEASVERYRTLAETHPDSAMYTYLYGRVLPHDERTRWFERSLELDADYAAAHRGLMYSHWRNGDLAAALPHARALLELDPDGRPTWAELVARLGLAADTDPVALVEMVGPRGSGFDVVTRLILHAHPERADAIAREIDAEWRASGWDGSFDEARLHAAWYAGDDALLHERLTDREVDPELANLELLHALSTGDEVRFLKRYEVHRDAIPIGAEPLLYLVAVRTGRDPALALELITDEALREVVSAPEPELWGRLQDMEPGVAGVLTYVRLQLGVEDPTLREALVQALGTALPWELPRS